MSQPSSAFVHNRSTSALVSWPLGPCCRWSSFERPSSTSSTRRPGPRLKWRGRHRRTSSSVRLFGLGTAMVYPTLLAAIGDVAHPTWRASAVGVYRLWRDLGYAVGALLAGVVADRLGTPAAIWLIAAITFASGLFAAIRMRETF